MNPLVSIVIPAYRQRKMLEEAVTSALKQTWLNIEVCISQDRTRVGLDADLREWCENLANREAKVRYGVNNGTPGLAGNWNSSAAMAQGKFLLLLAEDDRLLPECIASLMKESDDADVVFSNHWLINDAGIRLVPDSYNCTREYRRECLTSGPLTHPEVSVWQNAVPICSALIRTERVHALRFREDLNTPEIEFFLRVAQCGGRFAFVSEYLAEYRVHAESATASGLWTEGLVERLLDIAVSERVEPFKSQLLEGKIVNAVSRLMTQGQWLRARALIGCGYYPNGDASTARGMFLQACAALPRPAGQPLFVLARRLKDGVTAHLRDKR